MILLSSGQLIDFDLTFFVQLGLFFVAYYVLKALVFGPLTEVVAERERRTVQRRQEARRLREEAERKEARLKEALANLRRTAAEERDRLRAEGAHLERIILEAARTESRQHLQEALGRLELEAERVREAVARELPDLSRQAVDRILARPEVN